VTELGDLLGDRGATFSDCGRYRYSLWRHWSDAPGRVLFVMLNPSTADATQDDPTIRRCIGFARSWGAGGIRICNLYAWRATNPKDLPALGAVGEDWGSAILNRNDLAIRAAAADASRIIAAWGANRGPVPFRASRVLDLLSRHRVEALKLTKDGDPGHPLYVHGDTEPMPYREAVAA
jgi:hypothetical protein